jgi:ABC-type molybdate transport system substrate-binding protein
MIRVLALLIGIVCLVGCHAPPVQEMSDARQAIAAAQVAAAPAAIGRAEAHLQAQEYTRARLAALEAKHRAAAALATAERTAPPGEGPQSH